MAAAADLLRPLLLEESADSSREYRRGACLYRAGESPDVVFWLYRGRVELLAPTHPPRVLSSPALLGAERLLGRPCAHTVRVLDRSASIRQLELPALHAHWLRDGAFRRWLLRLLSEPTAAGE